MTYPFRRLVVLGVFVLGWAVSGCSTGASQAGVEGATGTSGQSGPAFLDLQVTPFTVVITNRVEQPLLDTELALKPSSGRLVFGLRIPRLEPNEKREIPLGQFRTRDGTPYNSSSPRPKEITAASVDSKGTKHEMTQPWRR